MTKPVGLELCSSRQIVHIRFPASVSALHVRNVVGQLTIGSIPVEYNTLLDFTETKHLDIPTMEMLDLAMKRRKMLPSHPPAPVRTAMLGVSAAIADALDAWESFLTESPPVIVFARFDNEAQAIDWLTARPA